MFCLFYFAYILPNKGNKTPDFMAFSQSQSYKSWARYTFENVCMSHILEIKKALGISGIPTTTSSFIAKPKDGLEGTQIDLLVERSDSTIHLCEIKVKKLAITGANLIPDTTVIDPAGIKMITESLAQLRSANQDAATKNTIKLLHMMEVEPNIPLTDLKKIKCPVLVMGGDFDVIKPAHTLLIFENIPQAYLWILPESGHGTVHHYKNEFNKKVQHFFTHPYKKPNWVDWEP